MKRSLSHLALLCVASTLAPAQVTLSFRDNKDFKQVGPRDFEFLGGSWEVRLTDGTFTQVGCEGGTVGPRQPKVARQIPTIIPNCPLGTTAFFGGGDLTGNGVREPRRGFISIQPFPLVPFQQVAPFRRNEIALSAAPTSGLPRPISGFSWTDLSVQLQYNVLEQPQVGLEFTRYRYELQFRENQLEDMYDQIVGGLYRFDFPRNRANLTPGQQQVPFSIGVNYNQMVEAFPGPGLRADNNTFRLTNDDSRWSNEQFLYDAELGVRFLWGGINGFTVRNGDQLFFSIVRRTGQTEEVVYPPYGPETLPAQQLPELIPNTTQGSFELGNVDTIEVGDTNLFARLTLERNLRGTALSEDNSVRNFEWEVLPILSYAGLVQRATNISGVGVTQAALRRAQFIAALDTEATAPDTDYDGDGFDNATELGVGTDPFNPKSNPISEKVVQSRPRGALRIPRIQNTEETLVYQFVTSDTPDGPERVIGDNDPDWRITSNASDPFLEITPRNLAAVLLKPRPLVTAVPLR